MKILITRADGGVSIMTLLDGKDIEAEIKRWMECQAEGEGYVSHSVLDGELPTDLTFRDAWKPDLSVDMEKAKDLWRDRMRSARDPLMKALDVEQLRGRDVEAKKQELRDVTAHPGIDAAATPEELKAVWPECLEPAR